MEQKSPFHEFIETLSELDEFEGEIKEEMPDISEELKIIDNIIEMYGIDPTPEQRIALAISMAKATEINDEITVELVESFYNALILAAADTYQNPKSLAWICFLYGIVFERYFKKS